LWTLPFVTLFLLNTFISTGFYMTMPTLPQYAVSLGMTLSLAGTLTAVFSVVAIFARPVAGMLADRVNRKIMLMSANVLIGFATVGYSLSRSAAPLFVFRILHGTFFAFSSTVQLTMTSSIVPEERMGEGMGYMGISQILAMSIAPSLGLYLADSLGYVRMFRVSGLMIGLSGLAMAFLPYQQASMAPKGPAQARRFGLRRWVDTELILLAVIGGLFSLMNGVTSSYLPMLGDERGIAGVSVFFTVSSLIVLVIRPFAGKLMDRRGLNVVLLPSLIFGAVAMFCIGCAWGIAPVLLAALLKGAAQSSGQASVQAECARRSPADRRGVALSTCYLGNDLGNSLGAWLGGCLSGWWGYGTMFMISGVIVASGLVMMAVQRKFDARETRNWTGGSNHAVD